MLQEPEPLQKNSKLTTKMLTSILYLHIYIYIYRDLQPFTVYHQNPNHTDIMSSSHAHVVLPPVVTFLVHAFLHVRVLFFLQLLL
jgi:hypothetical protein